MPLDRSALAEVIAEDLAEATDEQRRLAATYCVEPTLHPIAGDTRHTEVWVVARKGPLAIWFDDVEWGFNCAPLVDGVVSEPGWQDAALGYALWQSFREA